MAKRALPLAGRAAGTFLGGPVGGAIGGKLASAAGKAFGLELEGLSPEDQEFEVAKRFVRFAGEATKKAAQAPRSAPAKKAAAVAVKTAAIRRARTRLPGGGKNPVAIIRIPRERMVSSGIASSLVHEVGHQGAALLGLFDSVRAALLEERRRRPAEYLKRRLGIWKVEC